MIMRIAVAFKVVADDQDILVRDNGELDYSKAHQVVSSYDLNAIEAAAMLKESLADAYLVGVSVGSAVINDSKLKKNVLARGVDELYMLADDVYSGADALSTAKAIEALAQKAGSFDLVVFGDGSADDYAQQVNVHLAENRGLPSVNGVDVIAGITEQSVLVKRTLDATVEVFEVDLPAVIAVTSAAALPRICSMKDILAAGKKPVTTLTADELGISPDNVLETLDVKAPKPADRKLQMLDAASEADIDVFVAALAEAIG
jgi:electron transfer flavoprotein beta subunit